MVSNLVKPSLIWNNYYVKHSIVDWCTLGVVNILCKLLIWSWYIAIVFLYWLFDGLWRTVNSGTWRDETWPDNWTAVTQDGLRSAQFEHTLLVTEEGVEVLTRRRVNDGQPWFMDANWG